MVKSVVEAPPFKNVVPVKVEEACEMRPAWKVWREVQVYAESDENGVPPLMHVPLIAKQPVVRLTPLPNVDEAVPETLSAPAMVVDAPTKRLPELVRFKSVVVALPVEEAMVKRLRLVSPRFARMDNLAHGDDVPMPKLLVLLAVPTKEFTRPDWSRKALPFCTIFDMTVLPILPPALMMIPSAEFELTTLLAMRLYDEPVPMRIP